MSTNSRLARRLGAVLETLTGQGARPTSTPAYGSWLLGRVSEPQPRRRVRLQAILTIFIVAANLLGIGVAMLLVAVAFPVRSEEHTSELQSRGHLVCRRLLEKT